MPLTLVLGPANSAKAGEVLGAYAAAAHRGAVLVVPTTVDAEHYSRELAAQGAVLGAVRTFGGLAGEIARRAGYSGRRVSRLQRELLLRRAVDRAQLETLAQPASAAGFARAAGELIAELQRALITPQRFAQALGAWATGDELRRAYGTEVASLYRAYVGELDRLGRVDGELFAWRALDALRAAPGRWGVEPVFFYGFDDLTALERDAVETLARIAEVEVTVSLTYEPGRSALLARAEAVEELRPLAARVLELPSLDVHYAPASRIALHHLERSLFESGVGRVDPSSAVRLLEAGGERAEAELLAAEVLRLARAGVPAEEVVVVCRSLASAAPVIERVFAQYGIEVASEHRLPFAHTALGRGVLGLARCALLDVRVARAEDLLDYLRCPGVLDRMELADALEADVRRDALRTAAEARERLGWRLDELDRLRDAADQLSELASQSRRLFSAPYGSLAPTLDREQETDAHALAALLVALSELQELNARLGGSELIELLERLEVRVGGPVRPGAVLLAEPLAIRARRFRAVLVCGLQEGAFPLPSAPEPFLSDERRHELAQAAGLRLRGSDDALARERYLFYACVSRAAEHLVLSYRSSDEEGNVALPSPFIADVAELLDAGWTDGRRRRLLADLVWDPSEAPTARELERATALAAGGAVDEPVRRLSEAALAHVRHRDIVSAGALETFADCPVKWLVERELAPDRFEPEPEPLARGSYMHEVLEEVLRRLDGPVTEQVLPDARRILDDVMAELPAPVAAGRPEAIRAGVLASIEADLQRFLAHEASDGCQLIPAALEQRFGFPEAEGSLPPLQLAEGVLVRGMIDRVDVDDRRAIVRDYKSGSARPEHQGARWSSDRQLQVALYMIAVRRLLDLDPVAGLYQPLGGSDLRPRGVYLAGAPVGNRVVPTDAREPPEFDEVLCDAEQRALALVARLRSGELTPCPETCSRDGCMYPGICRSS